VENHTYSLKSDDSAGTYQLMHGDGSGADTPAVDHVVALRFDYYGEGQPPVLLHPIGDTAEPATTYGPKPVAAGVASCCLTIAMINEPNKSGGDSTTGTSIGPSRPMRVAITESTPASRLSASSKASPFGYVAGTVNRTPRYFLVWHRIDCAAEH